MDDVDLGEIFTDIDFSGLTPSGGRGRNPVCVPITLVVVTLLIIGGIVWHFNSQPDVNTNEQLSEQAETTK
jgi:hypothetical protein